MGINTIGVSEALSMVQRIAPMMSPVRSVLHRFSFFLTLPLFFVLFPQASFACTQHEHLCIYHALGAPVNLQIANIPANQIPAGNNLYIYSIGTNPTTGLPSTVDFDNKVLLPSKTGDRVFTGTTNFNTSTGTAIVSATAYGQAHPPPDWKEPGDGGLQVYGSQYQVIFNNLTATAKHTGDPGGGEEGNIPGAISCPNMPAGARNCEAAVITGNVPSGIYEQKVRIFNFPGIANPEVDIQAGAYVTGQLVLVSGTHENRQQAYFPKLSGTGDMSPTYQYEVYNRGWNPHAAGVASYDLSKSRSWVNDTELGDHSRRIDTYRRTDTTHHQIYGDSGWDEKSYSSKTERIGTRFIAAPEPPPTTTVSVNAIGFLLDPLAGFKQDGKYWDGSYSMPQTPIPYRVVGRADVVETSGSQSLPSDSSTMFADGYDSSTHSLKDNLIYGSSNALQGVGKGVVNLGWTILNGGAMVGALAMEPFSPGGFERQVGYYENNRNIWQYDNGVQEAAGIFAQIGMPLGATTSVTKVNTSTVIATTSSRASVILDAGTRGVGAHIDAVVNGSKNVVVPTYGAFQDAKYTSLMLNSQSQLSQPGKIMAGGESKAIFKDAERAAKMYGGNLTDWVKMKSDHYTLDGVGYETHWIENVVTGITKEWKTKIILH